MEELYAQINELRYLLEEINKREIVNKEKIELFIKNRMITLENQLSDEIERVIKSVGEENE